MRLFIGINPSPEALAHAAGAWDRRAAATIPHMRWVSPERWHVTLAFLGEVDPDRIPDLAGRLDEVAATHPPLEGMRLAGAGTFRGVLWLGVSPTERHSPADRLARAVQREMRAIGIPVDRRPWRARTSPSPAGAPRRSGMLPPRVLQGTSRATSARTSPCTRCAWSTPSPGRLPVTRRRTSAR